MRLLRVELCKLDLFHIEQRNGAELVPAEKKRTNHES